MKSCIACHKEFYLFCQVNKHLIYKCKNCGMGFTYNLKAHYGKYHRDMVYSKEDQLFSNIFRKRVKIISHFSKPGRVLEVGCSTGIFLSLLKEKRWQVQGVEVSKDAVRVANQKGISVITVPFEKAIIKDKFDLIIFNHTLEHLDDPLSVLKKAKLLLKPVGLIYIDLPNFDSISAKLFKSHWPMLLPNEHLWHFTEKAFEEIFNRLNFKKIYIEQASGIWDYGNPLLEIWQSMIGLKKRFFINIFTLVPSLIISKLNVGSDLLIIARKNDF